MIFFSASESLSTEKGDQADNSLSYKHLIDIAANF